MRNALTNLRTARRLRHALRQNVTVGRDFTCGENCALWAPIELAVGNRVHLGSNVRIEADGEIGDSVLIANSVAIIGRSDHLMTSIGVGIVDADWVGQFPEKLSHRTIVGSDVWIGFGTIVLSGTTIGHSSVIGAGSVVTRDIPANSVAVGNPARVIGQRFEADSLVKHWRNLEEAGVRLSSEAGLRAGPRNL